MPPVFRHFWAGIPIIVVHPAQDICPSGRYAGVDGTSLSTHLAQRMKDRSTSWRYSSNKHGFLKLWKSRWQPMMLLQHQPDVSWRWAGVGSAFWTWLFKWPWTYWPCDIMALAKEFLVFAKLLPSDWLLATQIGHSFSNYAPIYGNITLTLTYWPHIGLSIHAGPQIDMRNLLTTTQLMIGEIFNCLTLCDSLCITMKLIGLYISSIWYKLINMDLRRIYYIWNVLSILVPWLYQGFIFLDYTTWRKHVHTDHLTRCRSLSQVNHDLLASYLSRHIFWSLEKSPRQLSIYGLTSCRYKSHLQAGHGGLFF